MTSAEMSAFRPKVAIVGAGDVGAVLAYVCMIRGDAREIMLYDINQERVEAVAMDIAHGMQFTKASAVSGSSDISICADADVVIITAGPRQKPGQSRLELASDSVNMIKTLMPSLLKVAPEALYILITNPVDIVTYAALKVSGLPKNRVFGTGTVLDTSRLRYLLSLRSGISLQNIHASVCGEHGDTEVTLWSTGRIGSVPIKEWTHPVTSNSLTNQDLQEIQAEVTEAAYRIIAGKGSTNYAIGLATTRILRSILRDEHNVLEVTSWLDDWHGISEVCMAVPTIVAQQGIINTVKVPLSDDELNQLKVSADSLKEIIHSLKL